MVGSDHFHQLWLDNMPQFLVGKAPYSTPTGTTRNASSACPGSGSRPGGPGVATLRGGLDGDFDLAFSNELRIDQTCPIITLRPQADLPIVPNYTNIFAPPCGKRCPAGRWRAGLSDLRVAIIGTRHRAPLELGGPRQFGAPGSDPAFEPPHHSHRAI